MEATERNTMMLRGRNERLKEQLRSKDDEIARYLRALNDNRATMQMQSDKMRERNVRTQELGRTIQRQESSIQAEQQKRSWQSARITEQQLINQQQERKI
jgi:hypothetical protein